jgi:hypothetical protein
LSRRTRRTTRGGGREEEDNERRRRGEEEEDPATDIKSNNPHLAGGEIGKKHRVPCGVTGFDDYFNIFMDRLKDSHLGNHAKNYPVHTNRLPVIFPRQFLGLGSASQYLSSIF